MFEGGIVMSDITQDNKSLHHVKGKPAFQAYPRLPDIFRALDFLYLKRRMAPIDRPHSQGLFDALGNDSIM